IRSQGFCVFFHPRFELRIGWLVLLDIISDRLFFEPERAKSHRVESFANPRITRSKFTGLLQRDFLPEARQMDNAKWTGNAGADQWNICVVHSDFLDFLFSLASLKRANQSPHATRARQCAIKRNSSAAISRIESETRPP